MLREKEFNNPVHFGISLKTVGDITFSQNQKLWNCVVSRYTTRNIKTDSSEGREKIQVGNSDHTKKKGIV